MPVAGRIATGLRRLMPCFFFFMHAMIPDKKLRGRDTPPTHRRYQWWRGMMKGAVAGTSPTGPWTDGGTGVQTPDNDDCQSMAHTTRPSMPLVTYGVKMLQIQQGLSLRGERNSQVVKICHWRVEAGGKGQLWTVQVKPCAHV